MKNTTVIFRSANLAEAEVVKALLESNGIRVFLHDEHVSRLNPFYTLAVGGIKLAVDERKAARAREVLQAYRAGDETASTERRRSPFELKRRGMAAFLVICVILGPIGLLIAGFYLWKFRIKQVV